MEKQKVFIPVSVEKELPPDDNYYHTIDAEGEPNCRTKESFKDFDEISTAFWLKESEGYFMNQVDFEKELRKAFRKGNRYGFAEGSDTERYTNHMNEDEYIQSLNIK